MLTEARGRLVAELEAALAVPVIVAPATITGACVTVHPASDWVEPLGRPARGSWRVRLAVRLWVPHVTGAQALAELEALVEQTAPVTRHINQTASTFGRPELTGGGADQEFLSTEQTVTLVVLELEE